MTVEMGQCCDRDLSANERSCQLRRLFLSVWFGLWRQCVS